MLIATRLLTDRALRNGDHVPGNGDAGTMAAWPSPCVSPFGLATRSMAPVDRFVELVPIHGLLPSTYLDFDIGGRYWS